MCFFHAIESLATEECEEVLSFLCLYHFPIFSCREQQLVLPTREECERLSTTTCQAELILASAFGYGDILPDCNKLTSSSDKQGSRVLLLKGCTNMNNVQFLTTTTLISFFLQELYLVQGVMDSLLMMSPI